MPIEVTGGDPNARAANAANLKYNAQQSAIERAIAALPGMQQAAQAGLDKYGSAGRTAINETFDQLVGNLETNRSLVNRDLGIQVDQVGQGFRDAGNIAEAARAAAIDRLQNTYNNNSAYQTVGMQNFAAPIETLAAQLIGNNAREDATYTGNLRNWAAQQDALMQAGIAGAGRDRSNRLSGFESELLRAVAEMQNEYSKQNYGFQSDLADILGERGAFEADKIAEYLDQLFGQKLQAANYNLSEQQAISDASYKQAQLAQQAAELALKADMARAENDRANAAASRAASSSNNDDYWRQKEYELKKAGVDAETARWLAQQGQQDFANRMGIAEVLMGGVPTTDDMGMPLNNTDAYAQILADLGIWKPQQAQAAGSQAAASIPQSNYNSGYGSKVATQTKAPSVKPVTPVPMPLSMAQVLGPGFGR